MVPRSWVESCRVVPETEEDLLDDLLGHRLLTQQSASEPEHRPGMTPVRLGQGLLVVSGDGDRQDAI